MEYKIKKCELSDCKDIARVVTISWNETYKGIVPDWFLEELKRNEDERAKNSIEKFDKNNNNQLVLEVDDKGRWYIGTTKTKQGIRQINMSITLYNALLNYRKKQQYLKNVFGSEYYTYHFEDVLNKYGKVTEKRIVQNEGNILQINKADMVFTRPNGKYVGRNILNYPFKIIHKELGIENCRFYDLRGSYATINLRNGTEIRDVADILGHKYIETIENFYISSTDENKKNVSNVFDNLMNSETINNIIKYEIAY